MLLVEAVTESGTGSSQAEAWGPGTAAHFPVALVRVHEPAAPEAPPVWERVAVGVFAVEADAGDKPSGQVDVKRAAC